MKIPLTLDVGFTKGEVEGKDGYHDNIEWLLLGPSAGMDFTWYKANRLGFTISVKTAWQSRINLGSEYAPDDYSNADTTKGIWDNSILLGVVF